MSLGVLNSDFFPIRRRGKGWVPENTWMARFILFVLLLALEPNRLTTGRIFFSLAEAVTAFDHVAGEPSILMWPSLLHLRAMLHWYLGIPAFQAPGAVLPAAVVELALWVLSLPIPFSCWVSRRLVLLGWAGSKFQIPWVPDWHVLWSVENCFASLLLFELEVPSSQDFEVSQAWCKGRKLCVLSSVAGFFPSCFLSWQGRLWMYFCWTHAVPWLYDHGSESIITNLFSQKKSTVRFCTVGQSVAVYYRHIDICACLSPICIF